MAGRTEMTEKGASLESCMVLAPNAVNVPQGVENIKKHYPCMWWLVLEPPKPPKALLGE